MCGSICPRGGYPIGSRTVPTFVENELFVFEFWDYACACVVLYFCLCLSLSLCLHLSLHLLNVFVFVFVFVFTFFYCLRFCLYVIVFIFICGRWGAPISCLWVPPFVENEPAIRAGKFHSSVRNLAQCIMAKRYLNFECLRCVEPQLWFGHIIYDRKFAKVMVYPATNFHQAVTELSLSCYQAVAKQLLSSCKAVTKLLPRCCQVVTKGNQAVVKLLPSCCQVVAELLPPMLLSYCIAKLPQSSC